MKLRKGFSLVEIVAVFAIIAIIGLAAMARFSTLNEAARVASLDTSFNQLEAGIRLYMANNGGVPPANLDAVMPFMEMRTHTTMLALFQAIGTPGQPVNVEIVGPNLVATISNLQQSYTNRRGVMSGAGPGSYIYTLSVPMPQ